MEGDRPMSETATTTAPTPTSPVDLRRNVVPDRIDLRDRPYLPPVVVIPDPERPPRAVIPVLHQESTNACTGFALASVVHLLEHTAKREPPNIRISPFMLYSMARRYDEFP